MVTEGTVHVKVFTGSDTNFQLIFCSLISNYLPVVNSTCKADVGYCTSEYIRLLLQEDLCVILF